MLAQLTPGTTEKIADGAVMAGRTESALYLLCVIVLIGALVVCWVVRTFVLERREDRAERKDARDSLNELVEGMMARDRESQRSCHEHSEKLGEQHRDLASEFHEGIRDLKGTTTDLKTVVHDFRGIAQQTKGLVEVVLKRADGDMGS
jgi:hypothetical protein